MWPTLLFVMQSIFYYQMFQTNFKQIKLKIIKYIFKFLFHINKNIFYDTVNQIKRTFTHTSQLWLEKKLDENYLNSTNAPILFEFMIRLHIYQVCYYFILLFTHTHIIWIIFKKIRCYTMFVNINLIQFLNAIDNGFSKFVSM